MLRCYSQFLDYSPKVESGGAHRPVREALVSHGEEELRESKQGRVRGTLYLCEGRGLARGEHRTRLEDVTDGSTRAKEPGAAG
jgi:hypothetical protein